MSKIDTIKRQNPDLNINLIDLISQADPSETNKYLAFLIKMLKENSSNNNMNILRHIYGEENLLMLKKFEEHCNANRIKNKDIGIYTSFKQIRDEVAEADEIVRLKELEKQTKVLYSDDTWLILIPLSYEASKMYGSNTRWCTTQKQHWDRYISKYKLIYNINKKTNDKWAISISKDLKEIQGWNSNDDEISPFTIPVPPELFGLFHCEMMKKETTLDLMPKTATEQYRTYKQHTLDLSEYSLDDDMLDHMNTYIHDTGMQHIINILNRR